MGKVNQLWQDERQQRFEELVKHFRGYGYTLEEAEDMANEDLAQEDYDNSQFGAGA